MTFAALFDKVTGFFDKRFVVTYFLPSLIFWVLLVMVWFAGRGQVADIARLWTNGQGTVSFARMIGFFVWLVVFANVLASQSMTLLRLYEGYWDFPVGKALRRAGQRWHQQKLARLGAAALAPGADPELYRQIYLGYPLPTQPEQVMPTRLGNILKNSELYPHDRYNLDAVVIWPRLYDLFPPTFADAVAELRTALDFMLMLSALAYAFALASGVYLLLVVASPTLFLLCFAGGLVVGWIAYRGALSNAVLYSEQIKVGFDLYRNVLLTQFRAPLPQTFADERVTWEQLSQFFYRNVPPSSWTYVSAGASALAPALPPPPPPPAQPGLPQPGPQGSPPRQT